VLQIARECRWLRRLRDITPLSLYKQGCHWYDAIPAMTDERFELLMNAYDECLREQEDIQAVFGLL
jgi:hypothetical protein